MPAKSEAIFTVRDADAVAALDRMYAAADKTEGKLREIDAKATELGNNKGLAKFAASAATALKAFDDRIDASKRKVSEFKAALDEMHGKVVDIDVTGVDRALAEVLALKAAISGLDGKTVSLPSEVRAALPAGYSTAMDSTRDIRLSSLFTSARPLLSPGGGARLPPIGGGQDPALALMNAVDGLSAEIRRLSQASQGITPGSGVPDPVRTYVSGGSGGGGGRGIPLPGPGRLPMQAALAALPLLGGAAQALGGVGAVAGAAGGALGLGYAAALPALPAVMIPRMVGQIAAQPIMQGIQAGTSYLQQQAIGNAMAPTMLAGQIAQQQFGYQQQQQMTAAQNQAQLAGLRAMGLGPGTAQYSQAVGGQLMAAAQARVQQHVQEQQTRQQFALQQRLQQQQARAQFVAQAQDLGINPQVALAGARGVRGLRQQLGQTFGAGTRGAEQMDVLQGALGAARGGGMAILVQQWDQFFPVVDRTLTRIEKFVGSKTGQQEIAYWTQGLPAVAQGLTDMAGGVARLAGNLTHDLAPWTAKLSEGLAGWLGRKADWAASTDGVKTINGLFEHAAPVWASMGRAAGAIGKGIGDLVAGPGSGTAASFFDNIARHVGPLVDYMNRGVGMLPQLVDTIKSIGRDIAPLVSSSGPFNLLLKILQGVADAIGAIEGVPGGSFALAGVGGVALAKAGKGRGGGMGMATGALSLLSGSPLGLLGVLPGLFGGGGGRGGRAAGGAAGAAAEEGFISRALTAEAGGPVKLSDLRRLSNMVGRGTVARGLGRQALSTLTRPGVGLPIAGLAAAYLASGGTGSTAGNVATGALSGAIGGASIGSLFPGPGTVIGGIVGGIAGGVGGLLSSGGGSKVPQFLAPDALTSSAALAKYANQAVYDDKHGGAFAGYGTAIPGFNEPGQTGAQTHQYQQILATTFSQIQTSTAATASQLLDVRAQLRQANITGQQRTALLQQMATLDPGAVTYGAYGKPTGVNQATLRQDLGLPASGQINTRQFAGTVVGLDRARSRLLGAASRAVGLASISRRAGLGEALRSGDPAKIAAELDAAQRAGNTPLVNAIRAFATLQAGTGTIPDVNQQETAAGQIANQQLTPRQRADVERRVYDAEHPGAAYADRVTGGIQNVRDFQRRHGLVPDGIVGPATRAAGWGRTTPHPGRMRTDLTTGANPRGVAIGDGGGGGGGGGNPALASQARALQAELQRAGRTGAAVVAGQIAARAAAGESTADLADALRRDLTGIQTTLQGPTEAVIRAAEGGGGQRPGAAHRGAGRPWWAGLVGGGGGKGTSDSRKAAALMGSNLAHNIALGMDTQESYAAVDAASKGLLKTVLDQWGSADALTGTKNAAWTLTQNFAEGMQWASQSGPGDLINKTMYNLGFNIAWNVAQGAAAGSGGGGGGGGGTNLGTSAGATGAGTRMTSPMSGPGFKNLFGGASGVTTSRVDAGVDYANISGSIGAVASGTIVHVYPNLHGFAQTIIQKLDQPVDGYTHVYYGLETGATATIRQGARVRPGQTIAKGKGSGSLEFGFWNEATGYPVSHYSEGGPASKGGAQFANWIGGGAVNSSGAQGIPPAIAPGGGGTGAGGAPPHPGVAQAVRHAGMVRAGHAAAPQKSVTVHVHMHNVRLTGGKAEFDKFMGDFTKEVERAMHTAVKVVTP
jgi:hypothetical protein